MSVDWLDASLRQLFAPWVLTGSAADAESSGERCDREHERERGRACARRLLLAAGTPDALIETGLEGMPVWPAGWCGSISHRGSLSVVAAARASEALSLGLDLELDEPCSPELTRRACVAAELACAGAAGLDELTLARVVISAKESLHKLQFPLTRQPSGLRRIRVLLGPGDFVARFEQTIAPFPAGFELHGRWLRQHGSIISGVCLAKDAMPPAS